jgi:rhodanese-related sulfurtransferase
MFGVPEVVYCPLSVLKCHYDSLPDSRPLIVADAAGLRSREAVELLRNRGITEGIINLAGGLIEWERDGLPLVIDKTERLTGSCMCQLRPRDKGN